MTKSMDQDIPRCRVLWLSHFLPWPPKGGLLQRSYHLMRELSRYHEVHLVAFRQHAHQPDAAHVEEAKEALSEFVTIRHVSNLPEDRTAGGRRILALRSLLPGLPYTIRWGLCGEYGEAVETAIQDVRPEIIHFDTVSLAPYLEKSGNIPATLTHHNVESHMLLRRAQQERSLPKKLYFYQEGRRLARYERKVAHHFRLHLVCADLDGERLVRTVGPVRFETVPNGVDLDYFKPMGKVHAQQADTMVFVGGLSWYPNASAMRLFTEKIWPEVVVRRPEAEMRIIGADAPSDLIASSRSDQRIKVMGFVDDIRPIVADSMVYVCPIFDGGGTKLKMIDAMAMGKAIVAHPVAAEGLGLEHGRNVLLSDDPAMMAELCIRLFDDPGQRKALGAAARRRAESAFGFKAIGRSLAITYRDFLS